MKWRKNVVPELVINDLHFGFVPTNKINARTGSKAHGAYKNVSNAVSSTEVI